MALCVAEAAAGLRVPVRHPGLGRRDADPERRRLRAGGGRDGRVGARATTARRAASRTCRPPSAASATARASSSTTTAASCSRSRSGCARTAVSGPLRYAELARTLDVPVGGTAPLADVREAVLALRRGKGMVIDPADPDSVSAGSFFTNPILAAADVRGARGARRDAAAGVAGAGRPRQDLGRVADRAGRLPAGLRRRPRRHLDQAHARARQPRRRHHGRADGARARDRRRRARPLRRRPAPRAGARRARVVSRRARKRQLRLGKEALERGTRCISTGLHTARCALFLQTRNKAHLEVCRCVEMLVIEPASIREGLLRSHWLNGPPQRLDV